MNRIFLTFVPVLALSLLAGCEEDPNRHAFDGVVFKAKTSKFKDGQENFTVRVEQAGQSVEGARQAGGFEGTRYCIANYGTSKIAWSVGPNAPDEALIFEDGALILQGQCTP